MSLIITAIIPKLYFTNFIPFPLPNQHCESTYGEFACRVKIVQIPTSTSFNFRTLNVTLVTDSRYWEKKEVTISHRQPKSVTRELIHFGTLKQ